jgi:hypothetical protein
MFQAKVIDETDILCSITFFPEIIAVYETSGKIW